MNKICLFLLCVAPLVTADDVFQLDNESVVSEMSMQQLRGGEYQFDIDQALAFTELDGESIGNVAVGASSGDNHISSGSLSSTQGVTSVIQNTGHNVLIQNATVINLSLE